MSKFLGQKVSVSAAVIVTALIAALVNIPSANAVTVCVSRATLLDKMS